MRGGAQRARGGGGPSPQVPEVRHQVRRRRAADAAEPAALVDPGRRSGDFGRASSIDDVCRRPGHGDFDLPTAPGSLREQFDLPLLGEDLPRPRVPIAAGPAADPMALFRDDPPDPPQADRRRGPVAGPAVPDLRRRSSPRGCRSARPAGSTSRPARASTSIEDIDTVPAPTRPSGPPIGV